MKLELPKAYDEEGRVIIRQSAFLTRADRLQEAEQRLRRKKDKSAEDHRQLLEIQDRLSEMEDWLQTIEREPAFGTKVRDDKGRWIPKVPTFETLSEMEDFIANPNQARNHMPADEAYAAREWRHGQDAIEHARYADGKGPYDDSLADLLKKRYSKGISDEKIRMQMIYNTSLVGAQLERADLRGFDLRGMNLTGANMRAADLSGANLSGAVLVKADLSRACVYQTKFEGANLSTADLTGAYGRAMNVRGARCWATYFRYGQFKNAIFADADLTGADFVNSLLLGARFDNAILKNVRNMDRAIFTWWIDPSNAGRISFDPIPGWKRLDESVLGGISVQENSVRERVENVVRKGWENVEARKNDEG